MAQTFSEWQANKGASPVLANAAVPTFSQWQSTPANQAKVAQRESDSANSYWGTLKNEIASIPQSFEKLTGIRQAAKSAFQSAKEGVDQIVHPAAKTVAGGAVQGAEGALKTGAGVAGVVFSPLAPITDLIGKAINYAGEKLSNTKFGTAIGVGENSALATDPHVERGLNALQNLGGIAMGILGAKAGDIKSGDIPVAKMEEIAQHPAIIEAIKKVVNEAKTPDIAKTPTFSEWQAQGKPEIIRTATEQAPVETTIPEKITHNVSNEQFDIVNKGEGTSEIKSTKTGETVNVNNADLQSKFTPSEGNKIAKSAEDINKMVADKGFEPVSKDDLAKFASNEGLTKQQTIDANNHIDTAIANNDLETLKSMSLGETPLPDGVRSQIFFNRMKDWAYNNDPGFFRELSKSTINTERSFHATELQSASVGRGKAEIAFKEIEKTNAAKRAGVEKKLNRGGTTVEKKLKQMKEKSDIIREQAKKESAPQRRSKLQEFINSLPDC